MISLDQLQDNWPILGGFVAGILAWGKTATAVQNQGKVQEAIERRVTSVEKDITSIKESAARMAASSEATAKSVQLLLERQLDR
jgi:hypothetical protein